MTSLRWWGGCVGDGTKDDLSSWTFRRRSRRRFAGCFMKTSEKRGNFRSSADPRIGLGAAVPAWGRTTDPCLSLSPRSRTRSSKLDPDATRGSGAEGPREGVSVGWPGRVSSSPPPLFLLSPSSSPRIPAQILWWNCQPRWIRLPTAIHCRHSLLLLLNGQLVCYCLLSVSRPLAPLLSHPVASRPPDRPDTRPRRVAQGRSNVDVPLPPILICSKPSSSMPRRPL